ncbi:MAG: thiamine diphosphokinase [Peptococcaceae bacterium]|nr:thiamine diphosphokinase [Peptococcaceae bacterium]
MTCYTKDLLDPSLRKAILVSGGPAPQPALLADLRAQFPDVPCLCADAGADLCRAAGVRPDGLIGDMDSLAEATRVWLKEEGVPKVVYPVEKNDSDQALATEKLFEEGIEEIIVIGGLGGRMDHELANMMELVRMGRSGKSIVYWDDINRLRYVGPGEHRLKRCSDYISIVPFSDDGMQLSNKGLYYPLDHFSTPFGKTRLISNICTDAEEAVIIIERGDGVLALCHDRMTKADAE